MIISKCEIMSDGTLSSISFNNNEYIRRDYNIPSRTMRSGKPVQLHYAIYWFVKKEKELNIGYGKEIPPYYLQLNGDDELWNVLEIHYLRIKKLNRICDSK